MIAKLEITGKINVLTGMHIGGTDEFAAIGAIDSPVVRDAISQLPMIPGSSLKGKMRSLLSRQMSDNYMPIDIKDEPDSLKRLFGDSNDKKFKQGKLQFCDMILANWDEMKTKGARKETEVKCENTISRLTAVATPRQIERAIRGSEFPLTIIYNVTDKDEIADDMKILCDGLKLLEYDYLGGHGSRGYGRIKFSDVVADCIVGDVSETIMGECEKLLKEV